MTEHYVGVPNKRVLKETIILLSSCPIIQKLSYYLMYFSKSKVIVPWCIFLNIILWRFAVIKQSYGENDGMCVERVG